MHVIQIESIADGTKIKKRTYHSDRLNIIFRAWL
ncbi:MAG: hypothetical protein ACI9CO_000373, partial [Candidatus Azotimanducaceae bacterium]